jgi:hypothetical protein
MGKPEPIMGLMALQTQVAAVVEAEIIMMEQQHKAALVDQVSSSSRLDNKVRHE